MIISLFEIVCFLCISINLFCNIIFIDFNSETGQKRRTIWMNQVIVLSAPDHTHNAHTRWRCPVVCNISNTSRSQQRMRVHCMTTNGTLPFSDCVNSLFSRIIPPWTFVLLSVTTQKPMIHGQQANMFNLQHVFQLYCRMCIMTADLTVLESVPALHANALFSSIKHLKKCISLLV